MPNVQINPARLNIAAFHGEKYNLVFNKKNKVTGVAEPVTGDYKVSVRKKGAATNAVELTGAPGITITGSQLVIKMDTILALNAGDYDMQVSYVDGAIDRLFFTGDLKINATL